MKQFRKQSLRYVGGALCAFLGLALVLLATGGYNIFAKFAGTRDIYALEADELEGSYCYGEVYWIENEISRVVDSRGNIITKEYVVPMGESEWMVLSLTPKYFELADKLMEETQAFKNGEREFEPESIFYIAGKVVKQDAELLEAYHDYFVYDELSTEKKELVLPYVWTEGRMGNVSNTYVYICGLTAIALIIAAVAIFIKWLTYGYQKELKNKKHKAAVQSLIAKTKPVRERAYVTAELLVFQEGVKTHLVEAENIVDTAVDSDFRGKFVLIKLKKGTRKMHTPDAEFISNFLQKTYRLEKKKQKKEEYKSILER